MSQKIGHRHFDQIVRIRADRTGSEYSAKPMSPAMVARQHFATDTQDASANLEAIIQADHAPKPHKRSRRHQNSCKTVPADLPTIPLSVIGNMVKLVAINALNGC